MRNDYRISSCSSRRHYFWSFWGFHKILSYFIPFFWHPLIPCKQYFVPKGQFKSEADWRPRCTIDSAKKQTNIVWLNYVTSNYSSQQKKRAIDCHWLVFLENPWHSYALSGLSYLYQQIDFMNIPPANCWHLLWMTSYFLSFLEQTKRYKWNCCLSFCQNNAHPLINLENAFYKVYTMWPQSIQV